MQNVLNADKIKKFIEESVETLTTTDYTCCEYKLDDNLSLFVGWSAGYGDEPDDTIIKSENDPDWAINIGIKSNHDYMKTDFDYLNFPYDEETGDVWDTGMTVPVGGLSDFDIEWYIEQYQEIKKAYENGEIVIDGAEKVETEVEEEEEVSFQEIVEMMDAATDYSDLYEAASNIANSGLRLDVENLIGQCEDDEDEIDQAVSIVTSDLLDMHLNDKNIENLNECKKVTENKDEEELNKLQSELRGVNVSELSDDEYAEYKKKAERIHELTDKIYSIKDLTESKKLTEEVQDQVYDIAEFILNEIGNKKDVSMNEYNDLLEKGKAKYNFDDDDLDADVRTILSHNGFGTNFETGDLSTDTDKLEESADTLDNADEEDLATMLYSDVMEYASFDGGKISDGYELQSLEEVQDWYDSNVTEETYNKVVAIVENVLHNTKYYNDSESARDNISIELNDNHTLWQIDFPEGYDENEGYYFQEETYPMMVNEAAKEFEERTGVPLKFLGRSGRHVCVANTFQNALKYNELKAAQEELEEKLINDVNAMLNEGKEIKTEAEVRRGEPQKGYESAMTFAGKLAADLKSRGFGVRINGEDEYVGLTVIQGEKQMRACSYIGDPEGTYGFDVDSIALGGDTDGVTVLPLYVSSWDYETGDPKAGQPAEGQEVYAMFTEIEKVTTSEVADIIQKSFDTEEPLDESKKIVENKMTFNMDFKRAESKIGEGRKILNDILENEELDDATDGFIRETVSKLCNVEMDIMNFKDSEKVTANESKKLEEKDTKKEYQDYCNDLNLDPDKKSSINKFLNDYAKNLASIQGTKDFDEKMAQVKKELREGISKKVESRPDKEAARRSYHNSLRRKLVPKDGFKGKEDIIEAMNKVDTVEGFLTIASAALNLDEEFGRKLSDAAHEAYDEVKGKPESIKTYEDGTRVIDTDAMVEPMRKILLQKVEEYGKNITKKEEAKTPTYRFKNNEINRAEYDKIADHNSPEYKYINHEINFGEYEKLADKNSADYKFLAGEINRGEYDKLNEAPNIELNTTSNILKGIADKINKTCSDKVTAQTAQVDDVVGIRLTRKGEQDLISLFDNIVNVMDANNIGRENYEIDLRGNDLILAVKNMTV